MGSDEFHMMVCNDFHTNFMDKKALMLAAAWMTIVQGFGGLRFDTEEVRLSPWLPEGWKRLYFSVRIRGSLLHVDIGEQEVALRCEGEPMTLAVYGWELRVGAKSVQVTRERA